MSCTCDDEPTGSGANCLMTSLVLSVCPGLDVLGMGFEDAGFCVVRGGDPMFGQRGIKTFHPPAGRFDGVIGGPPCQMWAQSHNLAGNKAEQVNLIPDFERVVHEAQPSWFLMENVTGAPLPQVEGYEAQSHKIYAWELGNPQRRYRRFTFGSRNGEAMIMWPHGAKPPRGSLTLTAKHNGARMPRQRDAMPLIECEDGMKNLYTLTGTPRVHVNRNGRKVMPTLCGTNSTQSLAGHKGAARGMGSIPGKTTFTLDDYRLGFGLAQEWDAPALLQKYKFKVLGNSVPLQVARALAEAVGKAMCGA